MLQSISLKSLNTKKKDNKKIRMRECDEGGLAEVLESFIKTILEKTLGKLWEWITEEQNVSYLHISDKRSPFPASAV